MFKGMIALRNEHTSLRRGSFVRVYAHEHVVAYGRQHDTETAVVAFNNSTEDRTVSIQLPQRSPATLSEKLTENGEDLTADNSITIPARSGRVWIGKA